MKSLKSLLYLSLIAVAANVCTFNAYGMKQKRDAQEKVQSSKKQQVDTREVALINEKFMPEIFANIFGYLPQKDLRLMTRNVCKAWNDLILNNHHFSLRIKDNAKSESNDLTTFLQKLNRPLSLKMSFLIDYSQLNNLRHLTIVPPHTGIKTLLDKYFKRSGRAQDPLTQLPKSLAKLNLRNGNITEMLDLTSLLNLKELDLSFNQFLNINTLASKLPTSLKILNLEHCNITNMPDLTAFPNLQELNLSYNLININTIALLLPTSLERLSLAGCNITDMPNLISLPNLKELDLSWNQSLNIKTLPLKLPTTLVKLSLAHCNITKVPDLTALLNLQKLDFSSNISINTYALPSNLPETLVMLDLISCKLTVKRTPTRTPIEIELELESDPIKIESYLTRYNAVEDQKKVLKQALPNVIIRF